MRTWTAGRPLAIACSQGDAPGGADPGNGPTDSATPTGPTDGKHRHRRPNRRASPESAFETVDTGPLLQ